MFREPFNTGTAVYWPWILRDLAAIACGVFLFVYGGLVVRDATLLAVMYGSALTLLGLPPAFRLDRQRREREDA